MTLKSLGLSLALVGLVLATVPVTAQETGQTTFTLKAVQEGSSFYFEGEDGTKNPTLVVPAGEQITVTLVNVGSGVHNIHVEGQDASEYVQADGEETTYTFTAPASGSTQYWCDPHKSSGMAGTVRVAGSPDTGGNGGNGGDAGGNDSPGVGMVGLLVALVGVALFVARRK